MMNCKKVSTLLITCLLLISTVSILTGLYPSLGQYPQATLTGIISDHGVDTNGNGRFDLLEVDVQINVSEPGQFRVYSSSLIDVTHQMLFSYASSEGYLETGIQYLNLSFSASVIYNMRFNPAGVSEIDLYAVDIYPALSQIHDVPLMGQYNYTQFESHAFFTGDITDRGVDTDGNGLFNYLEVGIEFNVTQAGTYEVGLDGLMEVINDSTRYLSDYYANNWMTENFSTGIHTALFNFSGAQIASITFSPTNISDAYLYDSAAGWTQIDHLNGNPLPNLYSYVLFDHTENDIQINLDIYPNGTLGVSGGINSTNLYPPSYGPFINLTMATSTTGDMTTGSAVGAFQPSRYSYLVSPSESTSGHLESTYNEGMLDLSLAGVMTLPQEARATYPMNSTSFTLQSGYSNGLVNVDLSGQTIVPFNEGFDPPLNATDFTISADSLGQDLTGNVTFHTVEGFPFADVVIHFDGNSTRIYFTGNVNVLYGGFEGYEINATLLDGMVANFTSQIPGQGPDSLYNKTLGYIECTQLDIDKTPWMLGPVEIGASIVFNLTTVGNYTGFLAEMLYQLGMYPVQLVQTAYAALESARSSLQDVSLTISYDHNTAVGQADLHFTSDVKALWHRALELVPLTTSALPPEVGTQIEAYLQIANLTADSVDDFSMNFSYSRSDLKFVVDATMLVNATQLKNDILPQLPDIVPIGMHDLYESLYNNTYCTLNSATTVLDYVNGTCNFDVDWTVQGDFSAELNKVKNFYIAAMNVSSPWNLPWTLRLLNETDVDINNFQLEIKMGEDWNSASFSGLFLHPSRDILDAVRFKLRYWMSLADDSQAPPGQFDQFGITINGKSEGNQTVLLYASSDVPDPTSTSLDYERMTWQNTSLSSLKELAFLVAFLGKVNRNGETYSVPVFTNSTVTSFGFTPETNEISLTVLGSESTGFCNVTIPKALLDGTAVSNLTIRFDERELSPDEFNVTENADYAFIYLSYPHTDHTIEVVLPEFQANVILFLLVVMTIGSAIAFAGKRKRLLGDSD